MIRKGLPVAVPAVSKLFGYLRFGFSAMGADAGLVEDGSTGRFACIRGELNAWSARAGVSCSIVGDKEYGKKMLLAVNVRTMIRGLVLNKNLAKLAGGE